MMTSCPRESRSKPRVSALRHGVAARVVGDAQGVDPGHGRRGRGPADITLLSAAAR